MKRQFLFLGILFSILTFSKTYSQVATNSLDLELPVHSLTETFSLVDKSNHIHYIYKIYDHIRHLEFDENLELVKDEEFDEASISQKNIVGYQISDSGELRIYVSANNKRKFNVLTLFENSLQSSKIELKLKGEKIIKAINYDNNFYLISIDKGRSTIHLYNFNGIQVDKKDYPFNTETFYYLDNEPTELSNLFKKDNVEFIEPNVPSTIEQTSSPIKIYLREDQLIFTLNHKIDQTKVLILNLTESSSIVKTFTSAILPVTGNKARSANSFIFEDKLFQISTSSKAMSFEIVDMNELKKISSYSFQENDSIPFKNSPIYQQYSMLSAEKTKEIEKTKKFLRKVSNSEIGVVVFKRKDTLNINIGGVKKLESNAGGIATAGLLFGAIGAVVYASLSPTSRAYDLYANTKSVYIKSLFSPTTFKNIDGKMAKNTFDKIRDYTINKGLKRTSLGNIIKQEQSFIFSYYSEKEQIFTLSKFEL